MMKYHLKQVLDVPQCTWNTVGWDLFAKKGPIWAIFRLSIVAFMTCNFQGPPLMRNTLPFAIGMHNKGWYYEDLAKLFIRVTITTSALWFTNDIGGAKNLLWKFSKTFVS